MAMKMPRFRLRSLMILVTVVAIALGAETTQRRWAHFRERAAYHAQEEKACHLEANQLSSTIDQLVNSNALKEVIRERGDSAEDLDGLRELEEGFRKEASRWRAEAAKHARKRADYLS